MRNMSPQEGSGSSLARESADGWITMIMSSSYAEDGIVRSTEQSGYRHVFATFWQSSLPGVSLAS